jgi:hypothetical protein
MLKKCFIGFLLLTVIHTPAIAAEIGIKQSYIQREDTSIFDREHELDEVVVKPKRQKYSRKNNPAVEIIRQVIAHKNDNRLINKEKYKVDIYEKLVLSMDEFSPDSEENIFVKKLPFLKNYVDTSKFSQKPVINVSLREKFYREFFRKEPYMLEKQMIAKRHVGLDETLDENETLTFNLEELFKRGINIFDDDINILLNRFVSPLSSTLAVYYYEYSIDDTITVDGKQYVNIRYLPASRRSYGFLGNLQIALDGTWSVAHATLIASRNINLNWVDKMRIEQSFQPSPDGTQLMIQEDIYADFRPHRGVMPLQAHLLHKFNNYDYDFDSCEPSDSDSLFFAAQSDWQQIRIEPLLEQEQKIDSLIVALNSNRTYRLIKKTMEIMTSSYIPTKFDKTKSKLDFGPIGSTFSSNILEGVRFRFGGMTTAKLHPHWFANGYAAYGLKDEKCKYKGAVIYSFQPRMIHWQERPTHNLSITHQYDVFVPGGSSSFNDGDNVFNSMTTGIQATQMQYIRKTEFRYEKEFKHNFSVSLWLKHEQNWAAGNLSYIQYQKDEEFAELPDYKTASAGIQLRYAPSEKPFSSREGKNSVFNMAKDAPIFTLSHQSSFKNVLGGDFSCNYTEFRAEKRLWLSSFGHIDLVGKAGRIWDKAPFPLLYFPITNQSLFIQSETFIMIRPMEFIADNYAALHATYYLKGWILNRISLINRLKLREVVSFNTIYGNLSEKNNTAVSPVGLFRLPAETQTFGCQPYMEASVGLDNIFRILRVDYVRRLNYRDNPNIRKNGFKIAFRFSF